jgi:hypothetical protein
MRTTLLRLAAGAILFGAGLLIGQRTAAPRKTLLHVFAFKAVEGATPQRLDDLWSATRKLASQEPAIQNIWMGKIVRHQRDWQYAVVMEFEDEAGHKKYETGPAHAEWLKTYSQIRAEPTFTLDLQGQ